MHGPAAVRVGHRGRAGKEKRQEEGPARRMVDGQASV